MFKLSTRETMFSCGIKKHTENICIYVNKERCVSQHILEKPSQFKLIRENIKLNQELTEHYVLQ